MPIVPDTKNWTWVLERPCPECGFDTRTIAPETVADLLRDNAAAWSWILAARSPERLRTRQAEDRWSALEYACHVRDIFRIFDVRLALMLESDDPGFPNWDQDATAIEDRYVEQDPAVVATELTEAAAVLADRFSGLSPDAWRRTGRRSDGASFSAATLARYMIHDPIHHLYDVGGDQRGRE